MSNYLSLDEAAKKLGIPTDKLVELRSSGDVRGFRDGASWKFPENEIDRLKDELPDLLASGLDLGSGTGEPKIDLGSDLNLAIGENDSDVELVSGQTPADENLDFEDDLILSGTDLVELDSAELRLGDPAILNESTGSALKIDSDMPIKPAVPNESDLNLESAIDLGGSDLEMDSSDDDDESGEVLIGDAGDDALSLDDDDFGLLESDADSSKTGGSLDAKGREQSSLERMSDLEGPSGSGDALAKSHGVDVLSELDLMSSGGLLNGDSDSLLGSDSSLSADVMGDSNLSALDDALDDDDDLVIADDDDDLVISSAGSDVSVAGDSGINLMSPSDSGLSLESEPLDLAGSSISSLDLGAELADGGSDRDIGGGQIDEEFQLSPSGIGLEADIDSASQVIEIEESGEMVADDAFGGSEVAFEEDGDVFGEPVVDGGFDDAPMQAGVIDDGIGIESTSVAPSRGGGMAPTASYEVPFTLLQTVSLMLILVVFSIGGILMTDLVRNMWTFTEPSAPVSSLTNWLIDSVGMGS